MGIDTVIPVCAVRIFVRTGAASPAGTPNRYGYLVSVAIRLRTKAGNRKPLTRAYTAGMTISVSRVEEIMPPIIGTAMRCMTSDPVRIAPTASLNSGIRFRYSPLRSFILPSSPVPGQARRLVHREYRGHEQHQLPAGGVHHEMNPRRANSTAGNVVSSTRRAA